VILFLTVLSIFFIGNNKHFPFSGFDNGFSRKKCLQFTHDFAGFTSKE